MRNYFIISLLLNGILLSVYFGFFHHKKTFSMYDGMEESLRVSTSRLHEGIAMIERINETDLRRRPELWGRFDSVFLRMDSLVGDFYEKLEGAESDMVALCREKQRFNQDLLDLYASFLWDSKEKVKIYDQEIIAKIKNFRSNILSTSTCHVDSVGMDLPVAGRLALVEKMRHDAKQNQLIVMRDFSSFLGGRGLILDKYFPVVQTKKGVVQKGEAFEGKVCVGTFMTMYEGPPRSLCINGEKIHFDYKTFSELILPAENLGEHTLEAVAEWQFPHQTTPQRDTTYFTYEVVLRD